MRKQSKRTKSVYTQQPTTNNSCTNHSKVLEQWFASLTLRFRTTFPELSNFARAARLFRMRWYCLAFTYSGWVSSSGSSADIWILPTGCGDVLVVVVLVDPGTEDWWQQKENKNIICSGKMAVTKCKTGLCQVCWAYGASGASSYIFVTDSHSLGGVANSRPANLITQEVFSFHFVCLFCQITATWCEKPRHYWDSQGSNAGEKTSHYATVAMHHYRTSFVVRFLLRQRNQASGKHE